MPDDVHRDEQALLLRDQGRSFAGIARRLGSRRAPSRRTLPSTAPCDAATPAEQAALRSREMARLDALGERLRKREDVSEEELARQLHGVKRLRKTLFVA